MSGCGEKISVARTLIHPGFEISGDYDIGLVELAASSTIQPVQLYEGGDLGFSDCNQVCCRCCIPSWFTRGALSGHSTPLSCY